MKASKFSEAQIAFVLKQAEDGTVIGEVCHNDNIYAAVQGRFTHVHVDRASRRPLPIPDRMRSVLATLQQPA